MVSDLPSADQVAKTLKIATAAAVDAKANRPNASESVFGETESRVEEFWKAKYDEKYATTLGKIQHLLAEKNQVRSEYEELVQSGAEDFLARISTSIANFKNDSESSVRNWNKIQNEYDEFRKSHDLARTHKPSKPFLIYLTIVIFVAESIMNASVFMPVMQGGLIAGLVVSGSVALINVGFSFITGKYFLPQWNLPNPLPKAAAVLLMAIWLAVVVGVNFGAGLLRQISENIVQKSADRLFDLGAVFKDMAVAFNPSLWPDFALNSILLMVVGGFFALVSLLDGYFSQDPYPGYARVGKHLDDAKTDYEDLVADVREELDVLHGDGLDILETAARNARDESVRLQNTVIDIRAEYDQFLASTNAIIDRLKSNIKTYRSINKNNRGDSECPPYFEEMEISDSASIHLKAPSFPELLGSNMDEDLNSDADGLKARLISKIEEHFKDQNLKLEDAYSSGTREVRQIEKQALSSKSGEV